MSLFVLYLCYYFCVLNQVNVNLAGLPSLVVPCGFVEGGAAGLPVGLQMISSSFSEVIILNLSIVIVYKDCCTLKPAYDMIPYQTSCLVPLISCAYQFWVFNHCYVLLHHIFLWATRFENQITFVTRIVYQFFRASYSEWEISLSSLSRVIISSHRCCQKTRICVWEQFPHITETVITRFWCICWFWDLELVGICQELIIVLFHSFLRGILVPVIFYIVNLHCNGKECSKEQFDNLIIFNMVMFLYSIGVLWWVTSNYLLVITYKPVYRNCQKH